MRRLARILPNAAAAAVSLVLCVGTAASWVRSYWRRDDITLFMPDARCYTLCSYRGGYHFWTEAAGSRRRQWSFVNGPADPHPLLDHPDFDVLGFGFTYDARGPGPGALWLVRLPQWLLAMAFGLTSFVALRNGRRRR